MYITRPTKPRLRLDGVSWYVILFSAPILALGLWELLAPVLIPPLLLCEWIYYVLVVAFG